MRLNVPLDIFLNVHRSMVFIDVLMAERTKHPKVREAVVVLNTVDVMCMKTFFFICHINPTLCTRPVVLFP